MTDVHDVEDKAGSSFKVLEHGDILEADTQRARSTLPVLPGVKETPKVPVRIHCKHNVGDELMEPLDGDS